MKKGLVFPLLLMALPAVAEDYQLFTGVSAIHQDQNNRTETQYSGYAQYFFGKRTALGPSDQFEYINTVSNVGGNVTHYDDVLSTRLSGEHFVGQLAFSGSVQALDDEYAASTLSTGYLVSDDLILRVHANHVDGANTDFSLSSSYNMQLDANDYWGVTLGVRDDLDSGSLSSRYFKALGNGDYVVVNGYYSSYVIDFSSSSRRFSSWGANAAYYISNFTSFSLGWNKDEMLSGGIKHFFTPNCAIAVGAYYREQEGNYPASDFKAYVLSLSWQV